MTKHIELDRKFWPVEADQENDSEGVWTMFAFGLEKQFSWKDLLERNRVVVLAEAGTGKTEEFRTITRRLREGGKDAFFCRIELLQDLEIRHSLDIGTAEEFEEWLNGNKEAYFFLDSVDEARLNSHASFEIALRRFANAISSELDRATIFVSCRVSNWRATADLALFLTYLPMPEISELEDSERTYTEEVEQTNKKAMPAGRSIISEEKDKKKNDIVFQLAPLNDEQIRHFSAQKGVDDTKKFIEAIERADAGIFAERPQDLLELIAYWKSKGCLGRHAEMLDFNIQVKLVEHDPDHDEQRPLSADDALTGAERLAAAITLQKRTTIILPDRPVDADLRAASVEPKESLPDWLSSNIQILLDRPIFDEAIYGTVRFHHREVREYLMAKWIKHLIDEGKSRKSIERLLFAKRYGRDVVIPSMRPIAAWLALWDERVRDHLRTIAPEVLIENGDPSMLPVEFRRSLLIAFAELYAERRHTGTSFDITMVRRLADAQLASTINDLLKKYATHDDVCILLLKLIWQGEISESVDVAFSYATDVQVPSYTRACAIRAVAAAGTAEQRVKLVNSLLAEISKLDSNTISEVCDLFFPDSLSVSQLLEILKTAKPPERYSSSQLQTTIEEKMAGTVLPEEETKRLLRELHKLLKSEPFIERHYCEISARYGWLLPSSIRVANQFIEKKQSLSLAPIVLDLFLGYIGIQHYGEFPSSKSDRILKEVKAWPEFRYRLFWHAIAVERERKENSKTITEWWQAGWVVRELWVPNADDLERLFEDLIDKPSIDDRLVALSAIFSVYVDEKRPRKLREWMKRMVAGTPELEAKLHEWLHPKPLNEEQKKRRRQNRGFKHRQEEREIRQKANRREWREALRKKPKEIKNVGNAKKGEIWERTAYLYDRIQEKRDEGEHGLGQANWRALIDEFGVDVARNFRDGCVAYWREYDPFTDPHRRTSNSIPWPRIIGLTGLAMEATDDPDWAKKISRGEAEIATHYAICELNGFPSWFKALSSDFPDTVDAVIEEELRWEIHESVEEKSFSHTLSALRYGDQEVKGRFKSLLVEIMSEKEPASDIVLDHMISLILEGPLEASLEHNLAELAYQCFEATIDKKRKYTWLIVLLCIDGIRGYELLKEWIGDLPSAEAQKETMINFCAALTDHGKPRFHFAARDYEKIEILGQLVPFVYQFIKIEEDVRHKGVYSPGIRDHAQETRSHLLQVVYDTPGRLSYDILMNLSRTVTYDFSKDRMDHLAKERAALDAEFRPWRGRDVAEFAVSAEKQPQSESDLYDLALVRLDDLKMDIEEGDESEATLLQRSEKETEIRTVFANRLKQSSRARYTVGSEEELADASRTDIRLNAPQVSAPVPIELKIADKWTLAQLYERLENQLIEQYMRRSRYGIFLVVHTGGERGKKRWKDNDSKKMLSFTKLVAVLKQHAAHLINGHSNITDLEVVGIDFSARLSSPKSNE